MVEPPIVADSHALKKLHRHTGATFLFPNLKPEFVRVNEEQNHAQPEVVAILG
jgi:hypothetical protein